MRRLARLQEYIFISIQIERFQCVHSHSLEGYNEGNGAARKQPKKKDAFLTDCLLRLTNFFLPL